MKRWKHTAVLLLVILFVATMIKSESLYAAEDTVAINVTGTYGQSEARQMLGLINDFRTGGTAWLWDENSPTKTENIRVDELTYDYKLEEIAMQRAMEIAVYYSHTRPNGEDCFTLNTVGKAKAENIAAGYRTYEEVFIGWREDNEDYEGQGHRRNMLSDKYNAIGIGHVVYNGTHYWVQEFSSEIQNSTEISPADEEQTVSVDILSSNITEKNIEIAPDSCSVEYGKTVALPSAQAQIKTTEGWPKNTFMPVDVTPAYSIENLIYASIEQGSYIKGCKVGNTNIIVSALGITEKVPLEITFASLQGANIVQNKGVFTYDGEEQKPEVQSVTVNGSVVDPSNYTVSYDDNVDAGTDKVIVTGRGNYTGSAETTFIIQPRSLDSGQVSSITNQEYTGNEIKPTVQISVNNKTLYAGQDYEISYQNNINVGEAAVNISFNGNDLSRGTDYSVAYSNNRNAGQASVTISGSGNYTGNLSTEFKIVPRAINTCTINKIPEQKYTGTEICPSITISYNGKLLIQDVDYEIYYEDNIEIGEGKVIITGKDNYTGTKEITFLIVDEVTEEDPGDEPSVIPPENPGQPQNPSTQPSQQTPSAQQPQTPSASASSPAPAIGATLVASDKKTVYKVTGSNTVEYKKAGSNKAKVTIPSTVTYQGRKYQVTSIGAKAFKNNKKLKKVVIPSTVRKIGKQAFINCKKLKSITIKTNKLNAKAIGSKAFKGINAKATIKVPKKKLKLYKKILRAKGVSASVRIK